jgi:DNA primase
LQTWFLVPAAGQSRDPAGKEPQTEKRLGKEPKAELVSKETGAGGDDEINLPLAFALRNIDHAHPYINERGITEETARSFGVGVFSGKGSMHGRCVLPIHNAKGELVAYAGRSIDGTEPRYKFPAGFRKSLELFNFHRVKSEYFAVVVEGFFDCMKVVQAGYPCVALMGSTMSNPQQKTLAEHFGQVILMLDGDEAGREAMEEIAERLQPVVYLVSTVELPKDLQPDQLSPEEIQNILRPIV